MTKQYRYEIGVLFDAKKAEEFLSRGMRNRPINHAAVKRLDEQEVFYPCANTIKVDWNGRTIDGQHRLHWVKTRNKTVRCDVLWDAPPDLAKIIDTGRARSLSDMLHIAGIEDAGSVSVILNAVDWVINGQHSKVMIHRAEELLIAVGVEQIKDALSWARRASRREYGDLVGFSQPRFNAALVMLLSIVYPEGADFGRAIFADEDEASPASALRARLLSSKSSGGGGTKGRDAALETISYFFDLYRRPGARPKRYAVNAAFAETFKKDVREWFARSITLADSANAEAAE